MLDFLRDAVWQFIGAALTAVGLVLAVLLALPQFRRKKLSSYITSTPVVSVRNDFKSALKLTFNGTAVDSVAVIAVRIWNSGQVPILPGDFVEPLRLHFHSSVKILETIIAASEPPELAESVQLQSTETHNSSQVPTVTLSPTLLNPGDYLDVSVLVTDQEIPRLSGRVVGVKSIPSTNPFQPKFDVVGSLGRHMVPAVGLGIAASMLAEYLRKFL